tara:strand:- start:73 stop:225 length:153 start_codon:yes stop_codon:yes gene_type:complete
MKKQQIENIRKKIFINFIRAELKRNNEGFGKELERITTDKQLLKLFKLLN